ncbi:MAG: serine/threonine-protein kinase [Firmicutes bacterium]|nr:serine/threonine-protein kinase [Bacillota bacterium]
MSKLKEGELIKNGFALPAAGGMKCVIEEFIGGGGQGEVYRVKLGSETLALKWYFEDSQKSELKASLKNLINIGAPNDNFLWPKEVIEYEGKFGYVMGLRPAEYQKSQLLVNGKINLNFRTVAHACLQLADSFRLLHIPGLAYQDINWGNLFINPSTGDILICDNDNVTEHGKNVAGIAGTYGFMAPEVVMGGLPNAHTDMFSLAVLMFRMLFLDHPFDGKRWVDTACWDQAAQKKYYGQMPLFIYNPSDSSNNPVAGEQDNVILRWKMYPQYIRDCFTKVFTEGLTDPENGRLMEENWLDVFRRLQESIFPCPYCEVPIIYDVDKIKNEGKISCWNPKCQGYEQKLPTPPRLRIKIGKRERIVVLNVDTKLYHYQLVKSAPSLKEGGPVVAEMAQNPKDPEKWGLRNLSNNNWTFTTNSGDIKDVNPDKAMPLTKNIKEIDFKTSATAEIRI